MSRRSSMPRPVLPPAVPLTSRPGRLCWAAMAMTTLLAPAQAVRAQTLMDVTGATVIQGTLNNSSTAVPGSGSIERARAASAAAEASLNNRSTGVSPAGDQAIPTPPPAPRGATGGAPAAPPSRARVNGVAVPTCSHGGLCHGALLRAMGGR
ncbi:MULTISPECIES: hypothetical protein [Aphanothece]|uniref:hypothetical protein n=1 Tax=Aphanothece TaxID=1121 RepID=UPI003984AD43